MQCHFDQGKEVFLGSDTDDALFERLCSTIQSLGGSISDTEWILGNSRQTAIFTITLPTGTLNGIADTEVGLTLRGEDELVTYLSNQVNSNSNPRRSA